MLILLTHILNSIVLSFSDLCADLKNGSADIFCLNVYKTCSDLQ
jgi:hypothetical protein